MRAKGRSLSASRARHNSAGKKKRGARFGLKFLVASRRRTALGPSPKGAEPLSTALGLRLGCCCRHEHWGRGWRPDWRLIGLVIAIPDCFARPLPEASADPG